MKNDFYVVTGLTVLAGLLLEAVNVPFIPWAIRTLGAWLIAFPKPDEHFADIIVGTAWPLAALLTVWLLRSPLTQAANHLARRFESDDLEVAGLLKVNAKAQVATLDKGSVTNSPTSPEALDVTVVEQLLEFAGDSDQKAQRLKDWISAHLSPTFDPEEFLTAKALAEVRNKALDELTKE